MQRRSFAERVTHRLRRIRTGAIALIVLGGSMSSANAGEGDARVYLTKNEFLTKVFGEPPAPITVWLDNSARERARRISGEKPGFRKRYWQSGDTMVWIVDVIGKSHPITVGIVTGPDGIREMEVLIYRESRGWEVREDFFIRQFAGASLYGEDLNKHIDGITGATLSVRAMERAARLALWSRQYVLNSGSDGS